MSSLTFSIPVKPHGLLGTPSNLKLQNLEKRRMTELVFIVSLIMLYRFCIAGLLRDVDAGSMGCTRGFQNLSDMAPFALWAVVQSTSGVISKEIWERVSKETYRYCCIALGLEEPEERNSSNFSWSNSTTRDTTIFSRSQTSTCAIAFSSVEKEVPSRVAIFCLVEKEFLVDVRFFLSSWKIIAERFRL